MNKNNVHAYGQLCGLFYDATEKYASDCEINFFAACIKQYPGRVLEAMSGSGRLQIPLMQRGYVVDGVDHSEAMLARCRERCAKLKLEPKLYQQSVENLKLPYKKYGTVIIAVGSLQLITDQNLVLKSLKNVHAHMSVGGNLYIDIFVPDTTLEEFSISQVRLDDHTIIRLTRRHQFDVEKKIANTFCLYELIVDGIIQKQENELIEIVWRTDVQWHQLLQQAGFEVVQVYDATFKKPEISRIIHAKSVVENIN
ncbi:class I SAM-dependent methyltransferase [Candidatus Babeliales bacterium]|nr:class I SAM-dependent methyltransferase [Candidatus Babeliales bacterium]